MIRQYTVNLPPGSFRFTVGSGSFHLPFTYRSPAEPAPAARVEWKDGNSEAGDKVNTQPRKRL